MKKNFLFGLFATAMLLLTTACQKENDLANGNEVMVNFEVSAPVIATRADYAYSDGKTATKLQYAVYNSKKELLEDMQYANPFAEEKGVGTAEMKDLKARVSMRLALGNEYYVLFWAEADNAPYDVNFKGMELTVKYPDDKTFSNDENRDAFYCWKKVTDQELRDGSVSIEMRRPFAQLNIGTGDTEIAKNSGVTATNTAVEVEVYTKLKFGVDNGNGADVDVVDTNSKDVVTFDFAPVPTNQDFPVVGYDYLAMNYLLASADKEVVDQVKFYYEGAENNKIETRTFTSIPLRRNYRTNIYGNLLTQAVDFNVEIKPAYENENAEDNLEDDVFVVSTDNELKAALAKDDEVIRITLADNVSLANMKIGGAETETIIIEGSGIVRSGNHTLTMSSTYMPKFETVNPNATLVLKNINLVGAREEGTWDVYDLTFNCNVILENAVSNTAIALTKANATASLKGVTINETHDYYAMWISAKGQNVTIDGLTINASKGRGIKIDEQYVDAPSKVTMAVKNATFTTAKKAAIMVKSAAGAEIGLNNIDLEGVAADQVNAVWVDEDAAAYADKVIVKGGSLAIEENKIVDGVYRIVNVNDLKNLATADDNNFARKTAILLADLDLNNEEWTPIPTFNGTFDGNGKTIKNLVVTGNNSNVGLFGNTNDGEIKNLTIENAKVSGYLNVGVVAGVPYTSKYTNITVKGLVQVNGMAYVGGVGGKNAYANWTDITVAVEPGSYVKANSVENGTAYRTYVGGVVGFNGEGTHSFTNITSNINVVGSTCDVGGMFGIAHYGNQFKNLTCSGDVEITNAQESEEAEEIGGIAGVWHNGGQDVVFTNCKFTGKVTTNIKRNKEWYDNLIGKPYSKDGKGKLIIDGYTFIADGVGIKDGEANTFYIFNANGLNYINNRIKAGETIKLGADIDLTGVEFDGLSAFHPENNNTFDGQNYTISNWTNNSGKSDMGFFCSWVGTIKNVKFEDCHLKTSGRSAIVAANTYCNIEYVTVNRCSIEDTYWACGIVAGLYNSGSVSNVTVTNSSVKSNGGTGGIVGVMNESAGTRGFYNCSISNSTVNNTGAYGEGYSAALICGMLNIEGATIEFDSCSYDGNTKKGEFVGDLYYNDGGNTIVVK